MCISRLTNQESVFAISRLTKCCIRARLPYYSASFHHLTNTLLRIHTLEEGRLSWIHTLEEAKNEEGLSVFTMLLTVNAFAWSIGVFTSVKERRVVSANAAGPVVEGKDLLLQGFNWSSHAESHWWKNLEAKVPHLAGAGFTTVWLPPATKSAVEPHGYTPQDLYCLDSNYGSQDELRSLLLKMKRFKIRPMADIVINHRLGTTMGVGGVYNRFDGIPLPWDEYAVTSDSGGLGNPSTGQLFETFCNIDHTKEFVRKDIIQWLRWLREIGFQDFRFDYAKGFSPRYIKEYIEGSEPFFCVGEYWVDCNYSDGILDYNQDYHRQQIVNWIDGTDQMSAAFDFTTKGVFQKAVGGEFWRLRDPSGKPSGVIGWWPSKSVTFIDNHDTGEKPPNQKHWQFPAEHVMEGYAYILTHPGIPSVFYDHLYNWGEPTQNEMLKLIKVRKDQGIRSTTPVDILEAGSNLYAARIGEHLCMKIGGDPWCPSMEWTLATSGHNYAVWYK